MRIDELKQKNNEQTAQNVLSAIKDFLSFSLEKSRNSSDWFCYPAFCPQQENKGDCGMYTLICAGAVARRAEMHIPPALLLGNSLRIEMTNQLFQSSAAQISTCAGDLYRPAYFLGPTQAQFVFTDRLIVPSPKLRKITDIIDLDSSSPPPKEESPTWFLNSHNSPPASASPPQKLAQCRPVPSSLAELRRFVERMTGKKTIRQTNFEVHGRLFS